MTCIIPFSYPTILANLCRLTILPCISCQNSLRFYPLKKMSRRGKKEAQYWRVVGSRPSCCDHPVRPIFVGKIQIFPPCQVMSYYTCEQYSSSSSSSKNGSSSCTETIEQERYSSASVASVKSEQSESMSIPNHSNEEELFPASIGSSSRNRHFNKRRATIDVRSEQRAGDVENVKSQQDESSLPTRFGKKRMPNYAEKSHYDQSYSRYETSTKKFYNSEGLLKIEPFDICRPASRNSGMLKAPSNAKDGENQNEIEHSMEGTRQRILRPGMVLLKRYLTHGEQINIVKTCQELGRAPTGFYQPTYQNGAKLCLRMMCLGLNWNHQTRKYEDRRSVDGLQPPSIPNEFSVLVQRAIQDAHAFIKKELGVSNMEDILPAISPDLCIVNFYTTSGRLGLHQDRDESPESIHKGLPVVSFSLGNSAEFLYGDQRDVDKAEKIVLESGDVLIFGGESRRVFHGVTSIIPNSAPKALQEEARLRPGRLNLTFRQY